MSAELIYRRVPVSVWTELTGLTADAIVLAMRLRTGPESTAIPGLVIAGRAGLAEALGWSLRRLARAARELETRRLLQVDWRARILWITTAMTSVTVANPSIVTGWRSVWAQLPACPLRDETILAALTDAVRSRGAPYLQALRGVVGNTVSGTVSATVIPTVGDTGGRKGIEEGEGGGGTVPPPSRDALEGSDPHLVALLSAYREVHAAEPPRWHAADLEKAIVDIKAVGDADVAAEIGRAFYAADGQRDGDTRWRDRGWNPHYLRTQAIPLFAARAQETVAHRRREAAEKQAGRERRERIAADAAEQKRREADRERAELAEIEALPPPLRAWRLTVRELPGMLGATLSRSRASIERDHLAIHFEDGRALKTAKTRIAEIETALARHAPGLAIRLLEAAA